MKNSDVKQPPRDPKEISFSAGGRQLSYYGTRTNKLVLHNSAFFTGREWEYVEHLRCRLSPYGDILFTGRIGSLRGAPVRPNFAPVLPHPDSRPPLRSENRRRSVDRRRPGWPSPPHAGRRSGSDRRSS